MPSLSDIGSSRSTTFLTSSAILRYRQSSGTQRIIGKKRGFVSMRLLRPGRTTAGGALRSRRVPRAEQLLHRRL